MRHLPSRFGEDGNDQEPTCDGCSGACSCHFNGEVTAQLLNKHSEVFILTKLVFAGISSVSLIKKSQVGHTKITRYETPSAVNTLPF